MNYEELQRAFSQDTPDDFSLAELLFRVVRSGAPERLLEELKALQYCKPNEILDVLEPYFHELADDPSPLDVVLTMKTLVALHQHRIRRVCVTRRSTSWEEIERLAVVGTTHAGTVTREIDGGYLVDLAELRIPVFLPESNVGKTRMESGMECKIRIESVDSAKRRIVASLM